jgi:hypothetical protein
MFQDVGADDQVELFIQLIERGLDRSVQDLVEHVSRTLSAGPVDLDTDDAFRSMTPQPRSIASRAAADLEDAPVPPAEPLEELVTVPVVIVIDLSPVRHVIGCVGG